MNNPLRIQRHLAKALAACAVLVAAALPMAVAGVAGAATPATLSSVYVQGTNTQATLPTLTLSSTYTTTTSISLTSNAVGTLPAGTVISGTGFSPGTYLTAAVTFTAGSGLTQNATVSAATSGSSTNSVTASNPTLTAGVDSGTTTVALTSQAPRTLAAGTILAGQSGIPGGDYLVSAVTFTAGSGLTQNATLAVAATTTAAAVTDYNAVMPTFGAGASATFYFSGSGFAANGSTVTLASTPTGLTFTNATESTGGLLGSATYTAAANATAGFYSLTVTDGNGTSNAVSSAFQVNSAPTISSVSPSTIAAGSTATVSITGTGFVSGATATFTSTVDGTKLTGSGGATTFGSSTQVSLSVTATNSVAGAATPGTYTVTVTNPDGGTVTSAALLSVTAFEIDSVSPSIIPVSASAPTTTTVVVSGAGFTPGGIVQLGTTHGGNQDASWLGVPTITATTATFTVTVPAGATAQAYDLTIVDTNGTTVYADGALGVGVSSTFSGNTPTVTSVGNLGTLSYGSVGNLIINGSGFSTATSGTTVAFYAGTSTNAANISCSSVTEISYTQLECALNSISHSAIAGSDSVIVTTAAGDSNQFAGALTVAGPIITSASPSVLSLNSAETITLTGTGFTSTDSANVTGATGGTFTYVSPTQVTVAISSVTANVHIAVADSASTTSASIVLTVGTPPSVTTTSYAANTSGVGQGATSIPVTITGSGFLPGATVTSSTSGVSLTVTSVTSTTILAKATVASSVGVGTAPLVVSNTNGGAFTTTTSTEGLNVVAGPAGTSSISASPSASVRAGATSTLTLSAGTSGQLESGAVVTSSNTLLTVGTVTYSSTTGKLSVPLTASAMNGTSPISTTLTVTNLDGGVGTLTVTINPGPTVTGTYNVPTSSQNLQVIVSGTGFENGMTATSSNADFAVVLGGVNLAVAPSLTTTAVLVVSTDSKAIAGTSSNVTLTNPDGSTVTFTLNGPAGTTPPPPPPPASAFKLGKVHGAAVHGYKVTVTMSGTGFYGAPKITSNAPGTRAFVVHDTGSLITIRVISGIHARGWHTFTVTLANGKSAKRNYFTR